MYYFPKWQYDFFTKLIDDDNDNDDKDEEVNDGEFIAAIGIDVESQFEC